MDPLLKPSVNKLVLSNYIRHADSHNKVQEEREMWRQRGLEVWSQHELGRQRQRGPPLVRGRLVSDTLSPPREAEPHGYYWTRQLMKAEESDPFRWGHSGYKELHPEEFISSESDSEGKKLARKRRKKLKRERRHKKRKEKVKDESGLSRGEADLPKDLPKRKCKPCNNSESEEDYAWKRKKHKSRPRDSATESESEEDYARKRNRAGSAKKSKTSRRSSASSEEDGSYSENHRGRSRKKSKKSHKDLVSS